MVEVKAYEKWVTKVMSCVSVGLFPNSVVPMMIPERALDLSRSLKIKEAMDRLDDCLAKNASVSDINKMKPNPFNLLIETILTAKKIKKQLHIQ